MNWDEVFDEVAKANAAAYDAVNQEKARAKADEEFQRGVRLGWWDNDGNSLQGDEEDEDEEIEE